MLIVGDLHASYSGVILYAIIAKCRGIWREGFQVFLKITFET